MITQNKVSQYAGQLRQYFNGEGFDRWVAIYEGREDLSYIRRTVHEGHKQMLDQAQEWLTYDCPRGRVLDAGCGTGVFSLRLAKQGYDVTGIDISPRMVAVAQQDAETADVNENTHFTVGEVQAVSGSFDVVVCFDVLIHYPQDMLVEICHQLAACSTQSLLITYAPYSNLLALMHWVGGHFPKGDRRTQIQMTRDSVIASALADAGMQIKRRVVISQGFYHVKLVQAEPRG